MSSFLEDKAWADRFIPEIRRIAGERMLVPAPMELDCRRATDLIVLNAKGLAVGCRVRRPGYMRRFRGEFTLRSHRDNGAKTELEKILEGWCDWYFYGHSSADGTRLAAWVLIDLAVFRRELQRHPRFCKWTDRSNGDGTHFRAFEIQSFFDRMVIASSGILDERSP